MDRLIMRATVIFIFLAALTITVSSRLFELQMVNGDENRKKAQQRLYLPTPVKAARGEILDRNGKPFVVNKTAFTVGFNKGIWDEHEQNEKILKLINIFEQSGSNYIDTLPISKTLPMSFTENEFTRAYKSFIKSKKIPATSNAGEIIRALRKKYKLSEKYTELEARKIIGVLYEMEIRGFKTFTSWTFAQDVDIKIISKIKEMGVQFKGVEIDTEPIRQYQTGLASHILGRVTKIYKEELESLVQKGYKMDDTIGKDGVEKAYEDYLRGQDGKKSIEINKKGEITGVKIAEEPKPGNNCYLTIDLDLQEVAESTLAKTIEKIRAIQKAARNPKDTGVAGGATVCVNIKTGEILALASNPTYKLDDFNKLYAQMMADPLKPMLNRVLNGVYPPGSVFKMVTAVAGLEEKIITPQTTIRDEGRYMYYAPSYTPRCWIFTSKGTTHGNENVSDAIRDSCNYFFFDVGRRLGISKIEKYGTLLGLGQKTGIELSGESRGILAGPTYRNANNLPAWQAGNTLQAAIGQSDNQFTPLQLASYISALAGGGKRYQLTLLKEVKSYDYTKTIYKQTPKLLSEVKMQDATYKAVLNGMKEVAENGTASSVFRNFQVKVGGKTGSAQVNGTANGVFAAFAPFDDPEIAVITIIEHAGSGARCADVAKAIFAKHFNIK